ncbi:MAG: MTAP family purine nucleoside phosphorylase [Microthrixaceae bacterium]|nr:MTAP family purine nucleoside phosphorylase [Microthrixaceae bacterium]
MSGDARADVGVIGGSGFSTFLDVVEEVEVQTRWGSPSAPVTICDVGGRRVAFLPRHGPNHCLAPHQINYRANIDAMRRLRVGALLSPFAAGSLRGDIHPGDLVVVDQFVDQTRGRADTFHDDFAEGVVHVPLADPYDVDLRSVLVKVGRAHGFAVHDGGTVVVIGGPRFATRAESGWYRSAGWHVINMTQYPEAALAAEAGVPFAGLALVTDYDSGVEGDQSVAPVTQEAVFAFFEQNIERLRAVLVDALPLIPLQ